MTEQQQPAADPMAPAIGAPAPATPDPAPSAPEVKSKTEPTGSGRFAVYNTTLGQYVGGVVDKRPSKADANAMVPKGHKTEVREV